MNKLLLLFMAGAMLVAIFTPHSEAPPATKPTDRVAMLTVSAAPTAAPAQSVTIDRAADGHFYTDAQVNGAMVRFLIDTGASGIALSKADAQHIGLQFSNADFTGVGQGAGGQLSLKRVTLDRVSVGAISANDVDGAILNSDLPVSLLGQSWLKRVGSVEIKGDRMVLR